MGLIISCLFAFSFTATTNDNCEKQETIYSPEEFKTLADREREFLASVSPEYLRENKEYAEIVEAEADPEKYEDLLKKFKIKQDAVKRKLNAIHIEHGQGLDNLLLYNVTD